MSYSNGKITAPVSITDVKNALGMSSNSLGYLINQDGDSDYINMFARYKPVIYDPSVSGKYAPITDNERAHTYSKVNGSLPCIVRHGIMVPEGSDYNTMVENATSNPGTLKHGTWEYDHPTGGQYKPYRLSDFSGYSHKAVCPIAFSCNANGVIPVPVSGNGTVITFILRANQAANRGAGGTWDSTTCLSWSDLVGSYQNYYFTVHMICKVGGNTFRYTKSGDTVYSMFQSNNIAIVNIDTKVFKNCFTGYACINDGAVWTVVMLLTATSYAGTVSNHEMMTGNVMRLEYIENADRRTLTVKQTTWTDKVVYLNFNVYVYKRSGYTNHYYIQKIVVEYEVEQAMNCAVDIEYYCPSGYISGVTTDDGILKISDSINMSGESSKTYQSTAIQTDFVCTQTFPDGSQIGSVNLTFTQDGKPVSKNINMQLNTVTTSKIYTTTVIDNS